MKHANPRPIDQALPLICPPIRGGKRVALFLDYDGTLREIVADPNTATPTPDLRRLLDLLAAQSHIDCTIISGRTTKDLEGFLGRYPFGLVAEHGATFRRPGRREWEGLHIDTSDAWKSEVRPIMVRYAATVVGSFLETKSTSLVWHYRQAEPGDAQRAKVRMLAELLPLASEHGLTIRQGKKIIEVNALHITKGAAVMAILMRVRAAYDSVLLAGDDATDESMFALPIPSAITVHIGRGDTGARFCSPDPSSFRQFLFECFEPRDTAIEEE